MHPEWYYKEFDAVFGSTRRYEEEVSAISRVSSFGGISVEEIGVGLGNHLVEVLRGEPNEAIGVDVDPEACRLSSSRFSSDKRVVIRQGDGFINRSNARLLYCFYCLPQQTNSVCESRARIGHLASHAGDGREAWVEVMDVGRHLAANLHRPAVEIFRNGNNHLNLRTEASKTGANIIYSGVMDSYPTEYCVPIARLDDEMISDAARQATVSFECHPLSSSNRRVLVRFF